MIAAAVVALMTSVGTVRADIITDWNFSVGSVFVSWLGPEGTQNGAVTRQNAAEHTNRTGNRAGISFLDDFTVMDWNSYDSNGIRSSSLELHSHTGSISTDGQSQSAVTMIHNNQVIGTSAPTPKFMDISVSVILTGWHDDGTEVSREIELMMTLGFIETPNKGYGLLSGHTQDDIFFVVDFNGTTQKFTDNDGNVYDVSLDAVFTELTGSHLDTAAYYIGTRFDGYYDYDPSRPLYGWSTQENTYRENIMDVGIVVRHETMPAATPEPASMLIVGLGLAGLGWAARRRR